MCKAVGPIPNPGGGEAMWEDGTGEDIRSKDQKETGKKDEIYFSFLPVCGI